MKTKRSAKSAYILVSVVLCALSMSLVDGVLQPSYAAKSAIKIILFLLIPMAYFLLFRQEWPQFKSLFYPRKRDLFVALGLGLGVYGLILGGYHLLRDWLDIDAIALKLTADGGVSGENFLWVSLYISFVNSLLEEFLFRGFAFITLKQHLPKSAAYLFSALTFAGYHFGMFAGSGSILIWFLALSALTVAGCVLNFLNEKSGNIYVSWLVHMFANFGINTIGLLVFGIL